MGSVYRAWDRGNGTPVAVKVMHERAAAGRFAREVELLRSLDHPAIVRFVAHGLTDEGLPCLVMEWLDGESLSARIGRGPLSIGESLALGGRVAEAIGAAHRAGIVHRDLKPGNVFLPGGSLERAKVVDFGIARADSTAQPLTRVGAVLGTPSYMAPEQARSAQEVGPSADVYALGAVLFRCLTGRRVFDGGEPISVLLRVLMEPAPTLRSLRPDAPQALDALVARMLAKEPTARPADGAAVAREIAAVASGRGWVTAMAPASSAPRPAIGRAVLLVQLRGAAPPEGLLDAVGSTSARYGVLPCALGDGSLLLTTGSEGSVAEQTARLASTALALRPLHDGLVLAVAAEAPSEVGSGRSFERAAGLLTAGAPAQIRLDPVAASLLGPPYELASLPDGPLLVGWRAAATARAPEPPGGASAVSYASTNGAPSAGAEAWPGAAVTTAPSTAATWHPASGVAAAPPRKAVTKWLVGGALAAVALGGLGVGLAVATGRGGAPTGGASSGSAAISAVVAVAAPCPHDACVPLKVPDPRRVDVLTLLDDAVALARRLEPEAQLALIALTGVTEGYYDLQQPDPAVFGFGYPKDGTRKYLIVLTDGKANGGPVLGARHTDTGYVSPVVPRPGCSPPDAYRAAVRAGFPPGGKVTMSYSPAYGPGGDAFWTVNNSASATTLDGATCAPYLP